MNEIEQLKPQSNELINQANLYIVKNQETYEGAAILKKSLSAFKAKVNGIFKPIVSKAYEAHQEAKKQQKQYVDPIAEAERIIMQKCKNYENKKEQERIEAQKKAEAEAEQKRKDEAEFAEAQGLDEPEEAPTPPPPVKVKPTIEKQTGLGIRRTWKFRITDEKLIPREYLKPDLVEIGVAVKKAKENTAIPGIEAYYE